MTTFEKLFVSTFVKRSGLMDEFTMGFRPHTPILERLIRDPRSAMTSAAVGVDSLLNKVPGFVRNHPGKSMAAGAGVAGLALGGLNSLSGPSPPPPNAWDQLKAKLGVR